MNHARVIRGSFPHQPNGNTAEDIGLGIKAVIDDVASVAKKLHNQQVSLTPNL